MGFYDTLRLELIKSCLTLIVTGIGLAATWFVGQKLIEKSNFRQKRRKLELSSANEFYRLYGEFFAVWKLWDYYKGNNVPIREVKDTRWNLLERASLVDAGIEALLVKVASERVLTSYDIENLGTLRQAFQCLREGISDNEIIHWYHSDNKEYLIFKKVSCYFSHMLASSHSYKDPDVEQSSSSLIAITSNRFEDIWNDPDLINKKI